MWKVSRDRLIGLALPISTTRTEPSSHPTALLDPSTPTTPARRSTRSTDQKVYWVDQLADRLEAEAAMTFRRRGGRAKG